MKFVVYLLVLLNVVFFLWETGFRTGQDPRGSYRELELPSRMERLALTREVAGNSDAVAVEAEPVGRYPAPEASRPAEPEAAPPETRPAAKVVDCFQIGPMQSKTQAEGFLDLLKSHTANAGIETKPGDVPDGWWVLFPKAASLEAGRENRRMLVEKGVVDTWLFDKGPLQWAISLGLFKTRDQAEMARRSFMDKNIVTEVVPRLVRGKVYWIRIPWRRSSLEMEEIVQVLNTQDPSLGIPVPIPCD